MVKLPPIEKIFEAWTAISDNRVKLEDNEAKVSSSDGEKTYSVKFRDNLYSSNDNATFWQGYAGYPVIAVLMLQNRLPLNRDIIQKWSDINWKAINTRYRNKYSEAVKQVATERGIDLESSLNEAEKVLEELKNLPIEIKRKI